jgi:uncharacterized DUF497 family protein
MNNWGETSLDMGEGKSYMQSAGPVEFDSAKDAANIAKHDISLARAADIDMLTVRPDNRFAYGEERFRAWGMIDGKAYCLAFTTRGGVIRPISLRRAHAKEMKRNVP